MVDNKPSFEYTLQAFIRSPGATDAAWESTLAYGKSHMRKLGWWPMSTDYTVDGVVVMYRRAAKALHISLEPLVNSAA